MDNDLLWTWLPIGVSVLSLILAGIALGWNIYRDVVLKAKVRVRFAIVSLVVSGAKEQPKERYLRITATNHGPGPVTIQMISGQMASFWGRMSRRKQPFVIPVYNKLLLNPRLPHRLEVGDEINLYLPYDERCMLRTNASHIGVSDSFGRVHFAPRKQLSMARKAFQKEFSTVIAASTESAGEGGGNEREQSD